MPWLPSTTILASKPLPSSAMSALNERRAVSHARVADSSARAIVHKSLSVRYSRPHAPVRAAVRSPGMPEELLPGQNFLPNATNGAPRAGGRGVDCERALQA